MQTSVNTPILIMWDMFKSLINDIPIYKEIMNERSDVTPKSYVLLRANVNNGGRVYGDGKTTLRNSDCDAILISNGYADQTNDAHNLNKRKIVELLKNLDINYNIVDLGYDDVTKTTQTSFSFTLLYSDK